MADDLALTNRISQWFRDTRKAQGISVSRSLEEKEFGDSKLSDLLNWIENNDYTREDVEKVLEENKESYETQRDGAGLKRDAGGKKKFKRKKRKLLDELEKR